MTLGENLRYHRQSKGFSQDMVAAKIGVSRQAVTKWESDKSYPSSENLLALASIYNVSVDELIGIKKKNDNKILKSNLTLIAITAQASCLNVAIQPVYFHHWLVYLFKYGTLLASSIWMCYNLKFEKDPVQYRKNVKIELAYCIIQCIIALVFYFTNLQTLGGVFILAAALIYVFKINPTYMNRTLFKKKNK